MGVLCACQSSDRSKELAIDPINLALKDVIYRFPELPKDSVPMRFYQLDKSLIIGNKNVEIQLWTTPDSIKDKQQIVLFKNAENIFFGIPLFSNTYSSYWNFEFENLQKQEHTFQIELNLAMEKLKFRDSSKLQIRVIHEFLFSILNCSTITESDSIRLLGMSFPNYRTDNIEDSDSCTVRNQKICKAIMKDINQGKYSKVYRSSWDQKNQRIYQFIENKSSYDIRLKIYRNTCNMRVLEL